MRLPLVAGNWKMNGSCESIRELLNGLVSDLSTMAEVVVCPPAIYVQQVRDMLGYTSIKWGLQNVSDKDLGAFTGEISPLMAKDMNCTYVIIGHSERRSLYNETDNNVAAKFCALVDHGLRPILCVGETLEERKADATMDVVARQIESVLKKAGSKRLNDFVIAYEPVWAIGTGVTATPDQAQDVHEKIRKLLSQFGDGVAQKTRILYGGSMKAKNVSELIVQPDVDGGLIGGASLILEDFKAICRAAG